MRNIVKDHTEDDFYDKNPIIKEPEKQQNFPTKSRLTKASLMEDLVTRKKSDILRKLTTVTRDDDSPLVLYKVLPIAKKQKEPQDRYSIEYLWNIGANVRF